MIDSTLWLVIVARSLSHPPPPRRTDRPNEESEASLDARLDDELAHLEI